jgi:hypothetical protein
MRPTYQTILGLILGTFFVVSMTASVATASEVFVVSSSLNGDANYMSSRGDGTFSPQEILRLTGDTSINVPYKFSYGNGLGDFDNDGDLDYIMGIGYITGNIYIYEKTETATQFADPVMVDTWGELEGYFAMDMAVADFNEDGNADFVLSLSYSHASGLYLGKGDFRFESVLLPETEAFSSAGADAADFNNDGHADFVIAPASDEPFYVNIGDGQGNFDTYTFDSWDGGAVYGVAAADFTGDGNADIVAAYHDYLYIYRGAGDGQTFEYMASYELPMNQSALDNYDFDGDGIQDLIVANFPTDFIQDPDLAVVNNHAAYSAGVAVFLGNRDLEGKADGTFTYLDTYEGGTNAMRVAVTGPPYQIQSNQEPVAVIEPAFLEITAGEEIVFDGSYSTDDDGNIISYEWNFGDGDNGAAVPTLLSTGVQSAANAAGLSVSVPDMAKTGGKADGVNPSYIYYGRGVYTVTLTVTDDKGASNSVQAEVHVDAVPAKVKFSPRKLNLKSKGKWILATIKLPDGYNAELIDRSSVQLYVPQSSSLIKAQPDRRRGFLAKIRRKIQRKLNVATVRFDRRAVMNAIANSSDSTALKVQGVMLHNGGSAEFEGSGTIKTYKKVKRWKWAFFSDRN